MTYMTACQSNLNLMCQYSVFRLMSVYCPPQPTDSKGTYGLAWHCLTPIIEINISQNRKCLWCTCWIESHLVQCVQRQSLKLLLLSHYPLNCVKLLCFLLPLLNYTFLLRLRVLYVFYLLYWETIGKQFGRAYYCFFAAHDRIAVSDFRFEASGLWLTFNFLTNRPPSCLQPAPVRLNVVRNLRLLPSPGCFPGEPHLISIRILITAKFIFKWYTPPHIFLNLIPF